VKKKSKKDESGSAVEDADVTGEPNVVPPEAFGIGGKIKIAEGDEVVIPCRVVRVYPMGEKDSYTSVCLETLEAMQPQGKPIQITVNSAMVTK
jgi:hypothetical protein